MNTHLRNRELVEGTHTIMCGLMGVDLDLVYSNPPGRTDCSTYVAIPIEDPDSPLIHLHEVDHCMWKTNLHALDLFAHEYGVELLSRKFNIPPGESVPNVESIIRTTVNVLDDLRVTSNRSLIWPGSAESIKYRWRKMVVHDLSKRSFYLELMAVGLGIPLNTQRTGWRSYESLFAAATRLVTTRRGYATVLVAAKQLLDATIELAVELEAPREPRVRAPLNAMSQAHRRDYPPDFEASKVGQALSRLSAGTKATHDRENYDLSGPVKDPDGCRRVVMAALGREPNDLARVCDESDEEVHVIAMRLTKTKKEDPEEDLVKGLGNVLISEITPNDVIESPLLPEHALMAERLRHSFERVRGRKKRRVVEDGGSFDPNLFIDAKLSHKDMDVFVDDAPNRGFSAVILADMSGSTFELWNTIAPTCAVLTRALKFPFSRIELWGFSGSETGVTHMFRFQDPSMGYQLSKRIEGAWKLTPLHIAIPFASKRLTQMQGEAKHLFVVTDGMPQQAGRANIPSTQNTLMGSVAESVTQSHRKGVMTTALLIGEAIGNAQASFMFGNRGWLRVPDVSSEVFHLMVDSVQRAFTTYLKR